jgi:hypothetical protein
VSFEVFLQCFDRGEPAGITRGKIRPLFPIVEAEADVDFWPVRYDDLNSCEISLDPLSSDPSMVTAIAVRRACGDLRLWEALLEIMRLGHTVLYVPGDCPPLVTSPEVSDHLPSDMVQALGQPKLVATAQDILDAVYAA